MPDTPWMVVRRTAVEDDPDGDVRIVAMADTEAGNNRYLMVQCPLTEPDAQDAELGMDSYCLLDEKGAVHYGGVRRAVLRGDTLQLTFDEEATAELELPGDTVTLLLRVPDEQVRRLGQGLHDVLSYGAARHRPEVLQLGQS